MKKTTTIPLLAAVLLFAGCTKEYGRNDIKDYVKNVTGQTPKDVSRQPEEVSNPEDTYTDYLWTVTMPDGTVFHVLDDYHWGMEALTNSLTDDYDDVLLVNRYSSFPETSFELSTSEQEGLVHAFLLSSFSDRATLNETIRELESIRTSSDQPAHYSYQLLFDHPYRTMDHYESTEADVHGVLGDNPVDIAQAETDLLYLCLDHQYACKADFSSQEIETALEGYSHRVGVRTSETEAYDFSHPLVASAYSYGISFATLHEALLAMGISVEGTPNHYSFTDTFGNRIEISYDFHHLFPEGREGYYYLCNDTEVNMDSYFYNHFTSYELSSRFGLDIRELWQTQSN